MTTASDSIVVYGRWLQTGEASLLNQIGAYNEADCRSLLMCRDWLVSLRPPDGGPLAEADARALDPEREAKGSSGNNGAIGWMGIR